jgi:hypothetical protein
LQTHLYPTVGTSRQVLITSYFKQTSLRFERNFYFAFEAAGNVAAVEVLVAGYDDPSNVHVVFFVFVSLGVVGIFLEETFFEVKLARAAFDDDFTTTV